MASTDITLIGLDEATLSDDLVTVLADPSTNGGYKASLGDLSDYVKSGLDYSDTATDGTYIKEVDETNGVISVTRETADTTPTASSTKLVTSGGVKSALDSLESDVESELSMELTEVSGNPITISDASNTNCETLIATLSPTQAGSGDPSPTNVRPISGVSQLSVNRTGKNIAPFVDNVVSSGSNLTVTTTSDGGIHISGTPSRTWADLTSSISAYIPSGTTITLSRSVSRNYSMFVTLTYTDASTSELITYSGQTSNTLTLSKDVSAIKLHLSFLSTSTNYDETIYPQLEFGSTATTYEPYQGTTLSLSLGSTVYGGSVDLNTGVLTTSRKMYEFDGSDDESWTVGGSNASGIYNFYIDHAGDLSTDAGISNRLKLQTTLFSETTEEGFFINSSKIFLRLSSSRATTVAELKTWLASNNVQICGVLSTPITTQLTPQSLRLLQGNNTLWTNAEGLEVEYQPNNFVGQLKAWILDQLG